MTFANEGGSDSGVEREGGAARVPYDVFVDWDLRLAREMPFFEALFERIEASRVVDVGCGSGMHAIALAKKGLEVVGIDPSEEMIAAARENADAAGVTVRFELGVFEETSNLAGEAADAVLALGNGLPHVDGIGGLRRAFSAFAEAIRPGGVLVLHLINHERLARKKVTMLPTKRRSTPDGDRVFVRLIDAVEGGFIFSFLTLVRPPVSADAPDGALLDIEATPWAVSESRSLHFALPPSLMALELEAAGFKDMRMYGDHSGKPLDEGEDESVIVVAVR